MTRARTGIRGGASARLHPLLHRRQVAVGDRPLRLPAGADGAAPADLRGEQRQEGSRRVPRRVAKGSRREGRFQGPDDDQRLRAVPQPGALARARADGHPRPGARGPGGCRTAGLERRVLVRRRALLAVDAPASAPPGPPSRAARHRHRRRRAGARKGGAVQHGRSSQRRPRASRAVVRGRGRRRLDARRRRAALEHRVRPPRPAEGSIPGPPGPHPLPQRRDLLRRGRQAPHLRGVLQRAATGRIPARRVDRAGQPLRRDGMGQGGRSSTSGPPAPGATTTDVDCAGCADGLPPGPWPAPVSRRRPTGASGPRRARPPWRPTRAPRRSSQPCCARDTAACSGAPARRGHPRRRSPSR